jgi:hypothetical protein
MGKKSIVRKPIEKLSEKEAVMVIEDSSDSESSEEETFDIVANVPPPPKLKKARTPAQIAATERMKEANRKRREAKKKEKEITLDTTLHNNEPVKAPPKEIDPDDKPLTMKQYKELMASQNKPAETKPKRKYVRKQKPAEPKPAPTPTPSPIKKPPTQMLFV